MNKRETYNKDKVYLNLKRYSDLKTGKDYVPGEIINNIPEYVNPTNTLEYKNAEELKKHFMEDLIELARYRNDIEFSEMDIIISYKNIKMLREIQRQNNYNQAFINRKLLEDKYIIGAMVTVGPKTYSYREILDRTKYLDDMPFIALNKLIIKVKETINFKTDTINLGYYVPEEKISREFGTVKYFLPNKKTTTSPQLCQIFNEYVSTGVKLIPMYDLSDVI